MPDLDAAFDIADLRRIAFRRLPRMVFDYIDGGSGDEGALAANVARLAAHRLVPDVLRDVSAVDLKTRVLGAEIDVPFVLSPTAAQRLFHHEGEGAMARAAARFGTAYTLSTIGSTKIEDVAAATPGPKWFQVYVWKDRGLVAETLARARAAGFTAAILTVDVPVAGNRLRDPRNGFSIPPRINAKTAMQALAKPGFLWALATHPRVNAANFTHIQVGDIMGFINSQFDRTVTWEDAAWMRDAWGDGAFAIKGIATPEDARRAVDIGASVWVSNHGGRQLDSSPATIDLLPDIVAAVNGATDIVFDGGVRHGGDIVKALALGATVVALGRAALYGLAAGGEAGVVRALTILREELARDLALLGCPRVRDLSARFVRPPV